MGFGKRGSLIHRGSSLSGVGFSLQGTNRRERDVDGFRRRGCDAIVVDCVVDFVIVDSAVGAVTRDDVGWADRGLVVAVATVAVTVATASDVVVGAVTRHDVGRADRGLVVAVATVAVTVATASAVVVGNVDGFGRRTDIDVCGGFAVNGTEVVFHSLIVVLRDVVSDL